MALDNIRRVERIIKTTVILPDMLRVPSVWGIFLRAFDVSKTIRQTCATRLILEHLVSSGYMAIRNKLQYC